MVRRWIALLTGIFFVFNFAVMPVQGMSPAETSITTSNALSGESSLLSEASPINIPQEFGAIEEFHHGTNGKTIIYIQDAHDSLEAQQNIANIIGYLTEKGRIQTVFEEGYEGAVPTDQFFGFIEDVEVKRKTAYFFMDKLRIGGAEYAHINRKKDFRLVGIDSRHFCRETIQWAKKHARNQERIQKELNALTTEIFMLSQMFLPGSMRKWLDLKERFYDRKLSLPDYLKRTLLLFSDMEGKMVSDYPSLSLFFNADKQHDKEAERLIQQINPVELYAEIKGFEQAIAANKIRTKRDRKIFYFLSILNLLKKLNGLEITTEEYSEIRKRISSVDTYDMARFIARYSKKSVVFFRSWEEEIHNALRVYETAEKRDKSFGKNIETFSWAPHEDAAVLVLGGFHKEAIEKN